MTFTDRVYGFFEKHFNKLMRKGMLLSDYPALIHQRADKVKFPTHWGENKFHLIPRLLAAA